MPEDTTPPSAPEPTVKQDSLLDLLLKDLKPNKEDVAKRVRELVVTSKFEEAVAKAKPLLENAIAGFIATRSELKKLKESPDLPGAKSLTGVVIREPGFSDPALKKIQETTDRLVKFAKILNDALNTGDFSKLGEIKAGKDAS